MSKEWALAILEEQRRTKRCVLWPDCGCRETLLRYQNLFADENEVWEFEELRAAETMIYLALECVAAYCPEKKVKHYAMVQLLNPYWNRQRARIELPDWRKEETA
jgi:hypothetical protein